MNRENHPDLIVSGIHLELTPSLKFFVREKAEHAQSMVVKAGQSSPELYTNGDHAFEALVARDDLDLAIIATPWNWHVEMAVAAMTSAITTPPACVPAFRARPSSVRASSMSSRTSASVS